MAPELLNGPSVLPASHAVDVFSVGVVFGWMLSLSGKFVELYKFGRKLDTLRYAEFVKRATAR